MRETTPSRPMVILGKMLLFAQERMARALGPRRTEEILRNALSHLGDRPIDTPQDLLELAKFMLTAEGLVKSVGESLKAQAILRGASEARTERS
jgi:hypothetical protein